MTRVVSANIQFATVRFLSLSFFFVLGVTRTGRTGGPILTIYTVSQKKGATLTMAVILSIFDRFAKFFHYCKDQ